MIKIILYYVAAVIVVELVSFIIDCIDYYIQKRKNKRKC